MRFHTPMIPLNAAMNLISNQDFTLERIVKRSHLHTPMVCLDATVNLISN